MAHFAPVVGDLEKMVAVVVDKNHYANYFNNSEGKINRYRNCINQTSSVGGPTTADFRG